MLPKSRKTFLPAPKSYQYHRKTLRYGISHVAKLCVKNRHAKYLIYKLFDCFYRTFRKYNFRHFFVAYCYTVILLLYSKQNHS